MNKQEILSKVDHTLLKPTATEEDIVKVYVNRIRNKIARFSEIDVETVRGIGYRGIRNEK